MLQFEHNCTMFPHQKRKSALDVVTLWPTSPLVLKMFSWGSFTRWMHNTGASRKKKIEYCGKVQCFLESSESFIWILFTRREIFQAFILFNSEDYGSQIMKTSNSMSQKIRISHKTGKKVCFCFFLNKMSGINVDQHQLLRWSRW